MRLCNSWLTARRIIRLVHIHSKKATMAEKMTDTMQEAAGNTQSTHLDPKKATIISAHGAGKDGHTCCTSLQATEPPVAIVT